MKPIKILHRFSRLIRKWFIRPAASRDVFKTRKFLELESRFKGALYFLKKNKLLKEGRQTRLSELPWYLLIGPAHAGKTSLLHYSDVKFILQRQFSSQNTSALTASEQCDWWVTRDACLIDVPSKYLIARSLVKDAKGAVYSELFEYLLKLIRKYRGQAGIEGLILALPLPEVIQQDKFKRYHMELNAIFQCITKIQTLSDTPLPCRIVITKCDLLPGFTDFFSEYGEEEATQHWGVALNELQPYEKKHEVFAQRFDALIKRLNQQLIYRLHHEHDLKIKANIKDFPFQLEQVKIKLVDFVKRFSNLPCSLQGIYLTSAHQPGLSKAGADVSITNSNILYADLPPQPRAYFIKRLFSQGFHVSSGRDKTASTFLPLVPWQQRVMYVAVAMVTIVVAGLLGKDFEHSIKNTYAVQDQFAHYQLQQIQVPNNYLLQALELVNALQPALENSSSRFSIAHLFSFFSWKVQQKSNVVYSRALVDIFMPAVKNYLTEYLKNAVNYDADHVYGIFKAYLMLSSNTYLDVDFVSRTISPILSNSMTQAQVAQFQRHLYFALNAQGRHPWEAEPELLEQVRRYLINTPSFQLGYIILKNMDGNNHFNQLSLGASQDASAVLFSPQVTDRVSSMFTAHAFAPIISTQTALAAQEAVLGNWVLGENLQSTNKGTESQAALAEQLRITYVNNYIDLWERMLANLNLRQPANLAQADYIVTRLMDTNSPVLLMLHTLYENTYFEPIISISPKLQKLGLLLDKNTPSASTLYQLNTALVSMHQYLQIILGASDTKKAAFEAMADHMQGMSDPITRLNLIAENMPDPIKGWVHGLADRSWHLLVQEAGHYLNTSLQLPVSSPLKQHLASCRMQAFPEEMLHPFQGKQFTALPVSPA